MNFYFSIFVSAVQFISPLMFRYSECENPSFGILWVCVCVCAYRRSLHSWWSPAWRGWTCRRPAASAADSNSPRQLCPKRFTVAVGQCLSHTLGKHEWNSKPALLTGSSQSNYSHIFTNFFSLVLDIRGENEQLLNVIKIYIFPPQTDNLFDMWKC